MIEGWCGRLRRVAKAVDCKSAGLSLRRFESFAAHQELRFVPIGGELPRRPNQCGSPRKSQGPWKRHKATGTLPPQSLRLSRRLLWPCHAFLGVELSRYFRDLVERVLNADQL